MIYFIVWFIGFCSLVGYGIASGFFSTMSEDEIVGCIMMSLFWPILVPIGIGIYLSYLLFRFLIKVWNGLR